MCSVRVWAGLAVRPSSHHLITCVLCDIGSEDGLLDFRLVGIEAGLGVDEDLDDKLAVLVDAFSDKIEGRFGPIEGATMCDHVLNAVEDARREKLECFGPGVGVAEDANEIDFAEGGV